MFLNAQNEKENHITTKQGSIVQMFNAVYQKRKDKI